MKLPNILIVGKSGSGKSTSLRNMNRDYTWIANLENKALPFQNPEFRHNYVIPSDFRKAVDWGTIVKEFREVMYAAANSRECSCIVVESFDKLDESMLEYQKTTQTGWNVWDEHNKFILERLMEYKYWPIPIIWMGSDDVVEIETTDPNRPIRRSSLNVLGRKWEGRVEREFEIVLHTHITVMNGKPQYWFKTNNVGECSAKTPMGMFPQLLIENDLDMVLARIQEYYGG